MSREHDLFQELRDARKRLNIARIEEQEARTQLSVRKTERLNAEGTIEEILSEIDTGKSGRPMLDAINAQSEEIADEHQREPTESRKPRKKTADRRLDADAAETKQPAIGGPFATEEED